MGNDAHTQIADWLAGKGYHFEWNRSINPPGDWLLVQPNGPRLLILDSVFEDNNHQAVSKSVEAALTEKLQLSGSWLLQADLSVETK